MLMAGLLSVWKFCFFLSQTSSVELRFLFEEKLYKRSIKQIYQKDGEANAGRIQIV